MKKYIAIGTLVVAMIASAFVSQSRHESFDALLRKHVDAIGKVDYANFKKEHAKLKTYIKSLESQPVGRTESRQEQMAYWINLYNALTINLILDNYPVSSIMKLDKAWDTPITNINGNTMTLNDVEHKVIRPKFNDARIHFAVNCAAKSCPKLLNEAYVGSKIESQLNAQTKWFINNRSFNQVSASSMKLSKIFEWYKDDFGDLVSFVNKYSNPKVNANATVSFIEYNWQLNSK